MVTLLKDFNRKRILQKRYKDSELDEYVNKVLSYIRARRPLKDIPLLEQFGPNYGIGAYRGITDSDSDASGPDSSADSSSDIQVSAGGPNSSANSSSDADISSGGPDSSADSSSDADISSGGPNSSANSSTNANSSGTDSAGAGAAGTDGDNNVAAVPVEVVGIATVILPVFLAIPVLAVGDPAPEGEQYVNILQAISRAYEGDPQRLASAAAIIRLMSFASDFAFYVQNVERYGYYGAP